jgi:acyl-coenzyme A thioesterase PaaI-like protein
MTEATFTPMEPSGRGTPLTLALGGDYTTGPGGAECMRVPFRADLVDDPQQGGIANGVVIALLDQACGFAVAMALRGRAEMEGRELRMGSMATLDLRVDYVRPARPGQAVIAHTECLNIAGEVAFVRGVAFETDPHDPVALAQAAFMISSDLAAA